MLRLNDDCICHIFALLDCRDQLMLTAVCERFRDIIVDVLWRSRFRLLRTTGDGVTDVLSCNEFQTLFELVVHKIEHLIITDPQQVTYTSYLSRHTWRPELSFYLCFDFPQLRKVECYDQRLHNGHVRLLAARCPLLEHLHVTSPYVTGEHIISMRHLRSLSAPRCSLSVHLYHILASLCLMHLNITGNRLDNPKQLAEALMSAPALQELHLSFGENTPSLMEHMVALSSPSERLYPLTVEISIPKDSNHSESFQRFANGQHDTFPVTFKKPTHIVFAKEQYVKFCFYCQKD